MTHPVSLNKKGFQSVRSPSEERAGAGSPRFLLALLPLVGLVALALVAGSASANVAPTGNAAGSYLSGAASEVLNFTITNPSETGGSAISSVEFHVPASGGTIVATGNDGGTWTASQITTKQVNFTAPPGESLGVGQSKTFRVQYTPPLYTSDTNEDWIVVSRSSSLGAVNATPLGTPPVNTVNWRTLGVQIFGIKDPSGAQDGTVSSNQTMNFTVVVRNTATTPVNGIRVRVAVGSEVVDTATFNAAGGSSTSHDVGPLKLGGTLGARTATASIQAVTAPVTRAMTLDVKRAPDLGSTFSSITNSTRFLSNDASAPTANRTSTITVNARNVGEVDVTNVVTALKVYNQAGQDRSTFFTITPATQTIASIAAGTTGSTTFTVAPTGPGGNAPFDRYHINATFSFTDPNNNTSPTSQFHNTTIANRNPNGFLIADSAVPQAAIVTTPSPSQRPFDRTAPNNEFTFGVSVSDDTLNASRVVLQLYPTDGRSSPLTAPLQAECKPDTVSGAIVCRDFMLEGNANVFSITKDLSRYELRGAFLVSVNVTDEAGNFLNRSIGTYTLTDIAPPAITNLEDSEADDEADLTTFITFQASVSDAYRVGRTPTGGNSAGTLNTGVFLRMTQDDTGEQIFPGDGLAMSLSGSGPFSNSGIYTVTTTVPRTGRVSWSIFACDAEVPANCVDSATNNLVGQLTIRSGVSMFFRSNGGNLQGVNYTSASVVHQQSPATFGGTTGNPLAGNTTFPLTVRNDAGGTETYVFGCQLLTGHNLSGVTACEVVTALAPGVLPLNKNNTVTVAVSQVNGGVLSPLTPAGGVQVPFNTPQDVNVTVTVPPTARPGEIGRVLFTVRSKFVPAANANVTVGFNVTEFRAVTFRHAPTTVEVGAFDIKPSRTLVLPMLLENPGNLPQRYELPVPTLPTGWTFDWESTDGRWNDGGNNISLSAAGSPSNANRTVINARITAPSDATPGAIPAFNLVAQAASGPSDTFPVTLTVQIPSLTIDPARPLGVHADSNRTNPLLAMPPNTTVGPTEVCSDPAPRVSCTFLPEQFVNFTLSVNLSSTKNPSNPSAFGKINAYVHLRGPDGTVENRSLQLVEVNPLIGGALLPGKNGTYQTVVQVRNKPGVYHFGLYADDGFNNDQFFGNLDFADDNQRFTVSEPAPLSIPFLWNRVVRADGTQLTPDVNNRFQASYGSFINVTVNLGDAVHIGRANLRVERILDTGQVVPATTLPIVMTRTAVLTPDGDRIKNATFEGSFRPTGSFLDNGGDYQFTIDAFDAVGNPVPLNTTSVFVVRLLDLSGPVVQAVSLTGAGRTATDNLDIETGFGAVVDVTVADNGDVTLGSNVDPNSVRLVLRKQGSTAELLNTTMVRDPANPGHFNLSLANATFATTGIYDVEISARDLSGILGPVVRRTITVLVNVAPLITVQSPGLVDGVRFASTTVPITVQISDPNVDPAAANAVRVEMRIGNGTFTTVVANVTGARPTLTVTIPIPGSDATFRVTATDTLGLSNTTEFAVRVDTSLPGPVAISVVGQDDKKTTAGANAPRLTVHPTVRFSVTAADTGSGVASVTVTARPVSGGAAREQSLASPTATFALGGADGLFGTTVLDGEYVIGAIVRDRSGNAYSTSAENVTVVVDTAPPTIASPLRPQTPFSVDVTDLRAGVRSVQVEWANTAEGARSSFDLTKGSGNAWSGEFPAEASGSVFFLVRATDNVGNTGEARCGSALCALTFGNRAPQVTVTVTSGGQPVASNGRVNGTVTIGWDARDEAGQQVLVTVKVRDGAGNETTLLADEATLTSVQWDTAAGREGAYTITVTGTDGRLTNTTTLNVVVRNVLVENQSPLPSNVNQGGSLLLAFDVSHPSKTVRSVNALLRVGAERETVTLYDDGTHGDARSRDGTWSATYTPRLRGQHTIDLDIVYTDNERAAVSSVGTFNAQGLPAGLATPPTFFAILALGAVVIALGVVGLRRWQ